MKRIGVSIGALAALLAFPMVQASAQTPPPAAAPAPVDGRATVTEIRRVLATNYVLPEVRPKLDAALAKGLAEGRYDVTDPAELVRRVNADMAAVTPDKHLGVSWDPQRAAALAGRPQRDDGPPSADQLRQATAFNHGIVELKILPGNVRYMELRGFMWAGAPSAQAYDDAMRFLRDGDAVIIDLRRNGGGSPDAVQYLISHFLEPNRPIVTFHMGSEAPNQLSSLATLPAGRMVGKPLYVLSSAHSASAAEEFLGHVGGFRVGEIIGETSAGAGFRNEFFPLPGGMVISVSVGRAVLASTGKDWEGVGIAPTTKVDVEKALDVARIHAMRRLALTAANPAVRADLEGLATLLEAQMSPVSPALPLTAYAGQYGERTLRAENGKLSWQRNGGMKLWMTPVGPNVFIFDEDPSTRVTFVVAGSSVPSAEMVRADGSRVALTRNP